MRLKASGALCLLNSLQIKVCFKLPLLSATPIVYNNTHSNVEQGEYSLRNNKQTKKDFKSKQSLLNKEYTHTHICVCVYMYIMRPRAYTNDCYSMTSLINQRFAHRVSANRSINNHFYLHNCFPVFYPKDQIK